MISKKKSSSPKLRRFFCPNQNDLQKKKLFTKIETDFPEFSFSFMTKIGNFSSKVPWAPCLMYGDPRLETTGINKCSQAGEVKVRLDWTRSNAKRRLATFANLREKSITSLAKVANLPESLGVVANLRDWLLHRLILITYV